MSEFLALSVHRQSEHLERQDAWPNFRPNPTSLSLFNLAFTCPNMNHFVWTEMTHLSPDTLIPRP
ncbi:hypothetical protein AN958_02506 [Leucoagaricus sp. SymC.cos]|nr:hypothetical protein AN958_02506 [Leucoagaricus sp. SymC.cos]